MNIPKLPEGHKLEVTIKANSGKTYFVTFSRIENTRVLFLVDDKKQTLKKLATAQSPFDLYPKAT